MLKIYTLLILMNLSPEACTTSCSSVQEYTYKSAEECRLDGAKKASVMIQRQHVKSVRMLCILDHQAAA